MKTADEIVAAMTDEERGDFYEAEAEFVIASHDGERVQAAVRALLALGYAVARREVLSGAHMSSARSGYRWVQVPEYLVPDGGEGAGS